MKIKTPKIIFAAFFVAAATGIFAQAPDIDWQKSLGGTGNDFAQSIIRTSDGGYVIAGYTESNDGDLTGQPDNGRQEYIPDGWLVKLNSAGTSIVWQKVLGGFDYDKLNSVIENPDGTIVTAGISEGQYYIAKLSADGSAVVWEKKYGGSGEDEALSIAKGSTGFDGLGYIVVGKTHSNDGDVTGFHGTPDNINYDNWVLRLDENGNILWKKTLGGTAQDAGRFVQATPDGGSIIAGYTTSTDGDIAGIGFHGDGSNPWAYDAWVIKLDANGNTEWQKAFGGTNDDATYSVSLTYDNNNVFSGYIVAGVANSGDGDIPADFSGWRDLWVIKLSTAGNIEWTKVYDGNGEDVANPVQQTPDGGYIVAGKSELDYWVIKLDDDGDEVWNKFLGGSESDAIFSLVQAADGGYVLAGQSNSNDGDVVGHHGSDNSDAWIVKLAPSDCAASNTNLSATTCFDETYNFNGTTLTAGGTYRDTLTNTAGCDSIVTLVLTKLQRIATEYDAQICSGQSYDFGGQQLTENGTYYDTLQTALGCDSFVTFFLTVGNFVSYNYTQNICEGESYTFNGTTLTQGGQYRDTVPGTVGCDSIVTLTLIVHAPVITNLTQAVCEGETFVFHGVSLTQGGTYRDTLTSAAGCDSIVVLALTINLLPQPTVQQNGSALSTQTFSSYQWLKDGSPISGATSQNYTATATTEAAYYSVSVTDVNGCGAVSDAVLVALTGIKTVAENNNIKIYPNPAVTHIQFSEYVNVQLHSISGQLIAEKRNANGLTISDIARGVYILTLTGKNGAVQRTKLLKE